MTAAPLPDGVKAALKRAALTGLPTTATETTDPESANGHMYPKSMELRLRGLDEMTPERATFLLPPFIPQGELTLLAGDPGVGKSSLALLWAAQASRGELGGDIPGPINVLLVCAEDDITRTVLPRLQAMGADLSRIKTFGLEVEYEIDGETMTETRAVDLVAHRAALLREIKANHIGLMIIDPISSRLGKDTNTHVDSEVREALEPFIAMAHAVHLSVVGVIHFNKSRAGSSAKSVIGSTAFVGVARSVVSVIPDDTDPDCFWVGVAKSNTAPDTGTVRKYRREPIDVAFAELDDDGNPVERRANVLRIVEVPQGPFDHDWPQHIDAVLRSHRQVDSDEHPVSVRNRAADDLIAVVAQHGGKVDRRVAREALTTRGHSSATLDRAQREALERGALNSHKVRRESTLYDPSVFTVDPLHGLLPLGQSELPNDGESTSTHISGGPDADH